jgi:O-antigen/teichoic acid export membrane protein
MAANPTLPESTPRLFHRVIRAGTWSIFGYGVTQGLRFLSNLLLTRLLFPEAFGLMAIVQSILIGISMLSDIGIEEAVIQSKKGENADFVNTAWTIQAIRGGMIWLISCLLALPAAYLYKESQIIWLLPSIGFTAAIGGLTSTNFALASRSLGIASITIIDIVTSVISLTTMITLAWLTKSIWSLVIGSLVGATFRTLAGHLWLTGIRNQLAWDAESLKSLKTFGQWIFVSTAVTFLVGEGNRLLIGGLLNIRDLAFFSLAISLNLLPLQIVQQIGARVLFPAYSEIVREGPERLQLALTKSRLVQIVPYWILSLGYIFFGERIIDLLYDDRYKAVGWMLEVLALGSLPQSIIISYGSLLLAKGLVRSSALLLIVQLVLQMSFMFAGSHIAGARGLMFALVFAQWTLYPFCAYVYWRNALWQPKIDVLFLSFALIITVLVLQTRGIV